MHACFSLELALSTSHCKQKKTPGWRELYKRESKKRQRQNKNGNAEGSGGGTLAAATAFPCSS